MRAKEGAPEYDNAAAVAGAVDGDAGLPTPSELPYSVPTFALNCPRTS